MLSGRVGGDRTRCWLTWRFVRTTRRALRARLAAGLRRVRPSWILNDGIIAVLPCCTPHARGRGVPPGRLSAVGTATQTHPTPPTVSSPTTGYETD
jgi:hypothetical protein